MKDKFLGMKITPLTRRRVDKFKGSKRGYWSLWIFLLIFGITLFAEVLANDKPLLIRYNDSLYFPVVRQYPETTFGGEFDTEADYTDPYVQELIEENGWMVWPLIPFHHSTIDYDLDVPTPAPPSRAHWLGTDDHGRDVVARLMYGFRISVLFGLCLVIVTSTVGVLAGATQGYFGGWLDLIAQRAIEIWTSMPYFFILIILASMVVPNFFWLLGLLCLFGWVGFVGVVRAEFLKARNLDYVEAARALGVSDWKIIVKHILPNAMVATLTLLPFTLSGAVIKLTSLDFIGFGLPPGSPSLGELLAQGKANLQAPWLIISCFVSLGIMLILLVFVGGAVRDAFDPRSLAQKKAK